MPTNFSLVSKRKWIWMVVSLIIVGSLGLPIGSQAFNSTSSSNISAGAEQKGATEKEQQRKECASCSPRANQLIYIPLSELPEARGGEIVFNSRSPQAMDVTPIFYKRDGESVIADPVQIQSGEIRYVGIRDLLPERYRDQNNWGGFALSYYGTNREMWAQFRFLGVNGGGNVDEFFTVKDESRSSIYEAAWWMPENSEAIIALGNTGDLATTAIVTFGQNRSRTINLAPHATELVREGRANMGAESVRIDVTGPIGSVVPTGIITTKDGSFNSVIRFYDPTKAKQASLFANGFRVRGMTPHMVLKNTTSSPLAVVPKFIPLAGNTRLFSLPAVVLNPNEATEVDLAPLMSASVRRKDLDVVSVEVTNATQPGSIIGSIYASDKLTNVSYDVPLRDSGPIRSMTGAYPWKIAKGYKTVAYLTNITDKEAEFIVEINYQGGKFTLTPRTLAAGETAVFDLQKIRDTQMKDHAGKAVPASASMGQFRWAVRGVTEGKIVLIGRAEMVNLAENISTSYSCPMDCGPWYDLEVSYPGEIPQGEFGMGVTTETASWNYGYTMGPYSVAAGWSADNENIVNFGPSDGNAMTINGVQVGEANVLAFIGWQTRYDWDGLNCVDLGTYPEQGGGPVQVSPHIESITPDRGSVNSTVGISIVGTGFGSGSTVTVAGTGISASVTSSSSSSLSVTLTIASNATAGNHGVTVTKSGRTSNSVDFFVQIPTALARDSMSGLVDQPGGCGVTRTLVYHLVDQEGALINTSATLKETFSNFSGPPGVAPPAQTNVTLASGVAPDTVGYQLPTCPPAFTATFTQSFAVVIGTQSYSLSTSNAISMGRTSGGSKFVDITLTP